MISPIFFVREQIQARTRGRLLSSRCKDRYSCRIGMDKITRQRSSSFKGSTSRLIELKHRHYVTLNRDYVFSNVIHHGNDWGPPKITDFLLKPLLQQMQVVALMKPRIQLDPFE